MFSLRSCRHTSILVFRSINLTAKLSFRPSVSFSSKYLLNSTISNPSLRTPMSASGLSAFDVLMSASKKKAPSPSKSPKPKDSSPRKRKKPVESLTPNLIPDNADSSAPASEQQDNVENSSSSQTRDAQVKNPIIDGLKNSVVPVYDKIVPALLSGGAWDLPKSCTFSPGIPVGPMFS